MEAKYKKSCPNCSQFYQIKSSVSQGKGNIPLFLSCGHSMCESCITSIINSEDPMQCKVCQEDMTISATDRAMIQQKKIILYKLFPINWLLFGEISAQPLEESTEGLKNHEDNYFIDLNAIIKSTTNTQAECLECHQITNKICLRCDIIMCNACYNKSHKNFLIFKNHALTNIEATPQATDMNCKVHKNRPLVYYCKDCSKTICMDCVMVGGDKSCKKHNIESLQEVNDRFLEDLNDIAPKAHETFKRLTKTAVDVGHLLHKIDNDTGSSSEPMQMLSNVEQHFSKLMSIVQKQKAQVMDFIYQLKCTEKESLLKIRANLSEAMNKANTLVNNINATSDPDKAKRLNLSAILDEAKQLVETPWYLTKDKGNEPLKITVNEDIYSQLSDYIHLEGNSGCVYKMCSTSELGPDVEIPPVPTALVFPPELPKDVRQKQTTRPAQQPREPMPFLRSPPKFISKSVTGSVSSINSCDGDGYQKPMVQQVQPFGETRAPKPLVEGSQELVYITHIVDPHNFYAQRSCHQNVVKELIKEFRNAASMPKPSLNHVAEGKLYLVLNQADKMWQRCRVISVNHKKPTNPTILVFCIDFGSTETVNIDKLRLLPAARLQQPLPLAIHCSLANCEPRDGAWTSDDAFLIQEIIDNKQVGIYVRAVQLPAGSSSATLQVDVVTLEGSVSLAHALAFHERARLPSGSRRARAMPNMTGITEKPKIFINNRDCKPNSEDQVYITLVVSPDKFFVRKKHLQPVFEKLCEELEEEYTALGDSRKVYLPEVGMSCVVNVEKLRDNFSGCAWARAIVHELPGRGRVRVFLPDCGILLLAHWSMLRYINTKYTVQRGLATECHLAGVTPLNKRWHPKSVELLQQYQERILTMHVDNKRADSVSVTLYDRSDPDDVICINTEMVRHKFAVTFGIFNLNTPVVEDQMYSAMPPLEDTRSKTPKPKPEVTVLSRSKPLIDERDLSVKDKGPIRLEAKVLHYQSPSLFYVSLIHQEKAFNDLYDKIQRMYSLTENTCTKTWAVGDRCCTLCAYSQTWRRAIITEILPDNNAKVFFSDFASMETVQLDSLRELTAELASFGDAAIKCHLCGIMPADGGEDWPSITKEHLKELLDAYRRVFITKLGNFKNKSMPVEVWVYHTIQGGALEPNVSEWRCLNRRIVDQGLAVPDRTLKNADEETENDDNDMLSFLKNVTSSVDDWLQLEPLPTKPLNVQVDPSTSTTPMDDTDNDTLDRAEASGSSAVFISQWLPSEQLANTEFMAMPTYVDNEAAIYLHALTQRDTLELIGKALEMRFKAPDSKAKYQRWTVGEPCVAKYYLDQRFYRGRVVEVHYDDSNCLVHYVDYGNEELCPFENMRKSIALYQIPIQAHRCVLGGIRPVGNRWSRDAMDYIHKTIVEKECRVKVLGETVNGVTPVDVQFACVWMSDHLVDLDIAVYSQGSQAPPEPQHATAVSAEPDVVAVDSDPDYILDSSSSQDSLDYESMKNQDWNDILAKDEVPKGNIALFPVPEVPEFLCNVTFINGAQEYVLTVIHDNETEVMYSEMQKNMQKHCETMPPLDGIFLNKACVALYDEDKIWYRASILEYSKDENLVKVRYVDYGNIAVVSVANIREISPELKKLPPGTMTARLYGIQVNPELDPSTLMAEYKLIFMEGKGQLHGKVIEYDKSTPYVELRNDNGELVYDNLITKGVFIMCAPQK